MRVSHVSSTSEPLPVHPLPDGSRPASLRITHQGSEVAPDGRTLPVTEKHYFEGTLDAANWFRTHGK